MSDIAIDRIKYAVLKDGVLGLAETIGFVPKNAIGIIPEGEEIAWLEVVDNNGTQTITVNETLKTSIQEARVITNAAEAIETARSNKILAIDSITQLIISGGFPFNSEQFSLSAAAQLNWVGLATADMQSMVTFPLSVTTINDGEYAIQSKTELAMFYGTGLGYIQAAIDSGRNLKVLVTNATTVSEIEAVIDSRI